MKEAGYRIELDYNKNVNTAGDEWDGYTWYSNHIILSW
jgi:hypothetical protein